MSSLKYLVKLILYQPLYNVLMFLVWFIPGHNIGWAIIVLTIIIRLILLPPSLKATYQQKRMRDLQPEMQKIQEQYKGDKQKQSQAMMAFYKENKVHPLGSCLPLLIQFPILIVLYYVFINGLDTSRFDLLYSFVPRPETISTLFLGLDLAKPDRFILPVITGILQYIQGKQMMPAQPESKDKSQAMQSMISKQMLYMMPLFTVIIAGRLPAALPLYWAITTLFGIAQQWWVFRDKSKTALPPARHSFRKSKLEKSPISNLTSQISKHGVEVTVRKKK